MKFYNKLYTLDIKEIKDENQKYRSLLLVGFEGSTVFMYQGSRASKISKIFTKHTSHYFKITSITNSEQELL